MKPFVVKSEHMNIDMHLEVTPEDIQDQEIIELEDIHVTGVIKNSKQGLMTYLKVQASLLQACAKTMKPVQVLVAFDLNLIFSDDAAGDYASNEISELNAIILGHVMLEKPYVVYHEDAKDLSFEEEKKKGHPAFEIE